MKKTDWNKFLNERPKVDFLQIIKNNPKCILKNEEYEELSHAFESAYSEAISDYEFGRHNPGPLEIIDFSKADNLKNRLLKIYSDDSWKEEVYEYYLYLLRTQDDYLSGFKKLGYDIKKLDVGQIIYRYGDDEFIYGSFYTFTKLSTTIEVRDILAVRHSWPVIQDPESENLTYPKFNKLTKRYAFKLKEPMSFIVGELAYQGDMYYGSKYGYKTGKEENVLQYYLPWNIAQEVMELVEVTNLNGSEF